YDEYPEKEFDKLREKIVLDLTLKVLQTQQVQIG
ncbi:Uracil permease, partial [Bacillus cereus]|nr:Uracil permease [Bacillus cereus]